VALVAHYSHASEESRRNAMNKLHGDKLDREKVKEFYEKTLAGKVRFDEFFDAITTGKF
jgi:hypothetical protein